MNKEIKELWVDALRSGKYEQGKIRLRNDNRYCCLGVLADIVDPDGWDVHGQGDGRKIPIHVSGSITHRNHLLHPSLKLLTDVGLNRIDARRLSSMNDSGHSFSEIADYIESYI